VSGDMAGCSARRGHKHTFYQTTQTMVNAGILPKEKIPTVKPGIEPGTS